jgi:hypothetical protein
MSKIKGWEKQNGTAGFQIIRWDNNKMSMSVWIDRLPYKKPEYEVYYHNHLTGETRMSPMDKCYNKETAMIIARNTMNELNLIKGRYVGGR